MEVLLQTYIHILQLKINEENSEKRKEQDIFQISADGKANEYSKHSASEPNAEAWTECKDFSRYCISAK